MKLTPGRDSGNDFDCFLFQFLSLESQHRYVHVPPTQNQPPYIVFYDMLCTNFIALKIFLIVHGVIMYVKIYYQFYRIFSFLYKCFKNNCIVYSVKSSNMCGKALYLITCSLRKHKPSDATKIKNNKIIINSSSFNLQS